MKLRIILFSSFLLIAINCFKKPVDSSNYPPIIKELTSNPYYVITGENATISADVLDIDNDNLQFNWSASGGTFSSINGNFATWTAPEQIGSYVITCSVSDGKSDSQKSIAISVLDTNSVLPPPIYINAEKIGNNEILITWHENHSKFLTGYNIYRIDYKKNEYNRINSLPIPREETFYNDTDLEKGYYNYRITSINKEDAEGEQSTPSNTLIVIELINEGFGDYVSIPAGVFMYQNNVTVFLDDYYISIYEISNTEFKKFIDDNGYNNIQYWEKGGYGQYGDTPLYWYDNEYKGGSFEENREYPVIGVSWYEANAYCKWLSEKAFHTHKLPSEKEWEKAARGVDGRNFPWGNSSVDFTIANYNNNIGSIAEITSYRRSLSPYGIYNMAGNVWEWCSDNWEVSDRYRIRRGGGWYSSYTHLTAYYRSYYLPYLRTVDTGFRVVREKN